MKFKTKIGNLKWAHISGKGSPKYGKDMSSDNAEDFEFKASMVLSGIEGKEVQKIIMDFWKENKPAKVTKPSSTFLKDEMVETDKLDEYGEKIKSPSGNFVISASTNTQFKGKPNKIAILNAKGQPLPISHPLVKGDVGVSDESMGVIHGKMAITQYEGKAFVKLYLSGIQFTKFVPYTGSAVEADELDVEDDGCSVEDDGCSVDNISEDNKPNL